MGGEEKSGSPGELPMRGRELGGGEMMSSGCGGEVTSEVWRTSGPPAAINGEIQHGWQEILSVVTHGKCFSSVF